MAVLLPDSRHFWCLPKTSCAFVEKVLIEVAGGTRVLQQHSSVREYLGAQEKPHYGTIVDPWTWYPRLWRHATEDGTRANGRVARYAHGELDAIALWQTANCRWEDFFWGAISMSAQRCQPGRELIITWTDVKSDLPYEGGLWSWGSRYMYRRGTEWAVTALLDGHCPEAALYKLGIDATGFEPYNTANVRPLCVGAQLPDEKPQISRYESWYTEEMLEAVWKSDGGLARELGYTTPFRPSTKGPLIEVGT